MQFLFRHAWLILWLAYLDSTLILGVVIYLMYSYQLGNMIMYHHIITFYQYIICKLFCNHELPYYNETKSNLLHTVYCMG